MERIIGKTKTGDIGFDDRNDQVNHVLYCFSDERSKNGKKMRVSIKMEVPFSPVKWYDILNCTILYKIHSEANI